MRRGKLHLGRWLFNAAGAAALLFAAAAVALCVRSHWATDSVWVRRGGVTATVMTARNGCLFHWTAGESDSGGRRWYRDSTDPDDMVRGNWRFWTQSEPHRLFGVITWGRARYGVNGWGMSILLPYWLLACGAAAAGTGLLMMSRPLRGRARRRAGQCVRCGYDLRATPDRCPECGAIPRPPHNPPMQRTATASSGAVE
jgi:hypothetical protein